MVVPAQLYAVVLPFWAALLSRPIGSLSFGVVCRASFITFFSCPIGSFSFFYVVSFLGAVIHRSKFGEVELNRHVLLNSASVGQLILRGLMCLIGSLLPWGYFFLCD